MILATYRYRAGCRALTSTDLGFLAQPTTTTPSRANVFVNSYPIPADAPVTIATLPFHLSIPGWLKLSLINRLAVNPTIVKSLKLLRKPFIALINATVVSRGQSDRSLIGAGRYHYKTRALIPDVLHQIKTVKSSLANRYFT